MTVPLNPVEQEELVREIDGILLSYAPEGWQELTLCFRSTVAIDSATFLSVDTSGQQVQLVPPTRALRLLGKLREGMYVEGKGTWFTAHIVIQRPGHHKIEYNYDSKPNFTPPLTPNTYALDFD